MSSDLVEKFVKMLHIVETRRSKRFSVMNKNIFIIAALYSQKKETQMHQFRISWEGNLKEGDVATYTEV